MGLKLPTYVGIGILLLAILLISVGYGCCNNVFENFETVSTDPPTPQLMKKIEDSVISQLATEKTQDSVATVQTVNSVLKQLETAKQETFTAPTLMQPVQTSGTNSSTTIPPPPVPVAPPTVPAIVSPTVSANPSVSKVSPPAPDVIGSSNNSITDRLLAQKQQQSKDTLDKDEQELFDQITKNTIPAEDLDKLIRAGVLTENMVEKFLNQINKLNEEKIEGFCSGKECYAKV